MPSLLTMAVTGLAGTAATGAFLVSAPWQDDEAVTKRETLQVAPDAVEDPDPDPTDDKTRDTNTVDSRRSRASRAERPNPVAAATRDVSVDVHQTSGVTRGTVSGGPGSVDRPPAAVAGGDASGDHSRDRSRDRSRDSRSRSRD